MQEQAIIVFADGAAKGNPGPGGWGAVIVTPEGRVTELGGGLAHTTNNQMELTGVIAALQYLKAVDGTVAVYSDSTYVIRGITQWVWGWRKRGWKTVEGTPVLNRDLWEVLVRLVTARGTQRLAWHYVRGHTGVPGNERVDAIASAFAEGRWIELYDGPLIGYEVAILDLPDNTDVPQRHTSGSSESKTKAAYSYLSVVDNQPMRHATWSECERRVKGVSGARFKKAMSAADEAVILRAWGLSPKDL